MYLYPPEAGWLPILVASYNTHGLRWDYSYSPVTIRGFNMILRSEFKLAIASSVCEESDRERMCCVMSQPELHFAGLYCK
jgi:hypothetical protein